jgi:hypothetical protein
MPNPKDDLKERLARYRQIRLRVMMARSVAATLIFSTLLLPYRTQSQTSTETLLSADNAYNPIPSPDGKYIAYVRTGWGRHVGISGFGRSNLVSEVVVVDANGNLVEKNPVANAFLSGWTPDSTKLVCYRDGEYSLVSRQGAVSGGVGSPALRT